jgi:hypothetical protein
MANGMLPANSLNMGRFYWQASHVEDILSILDWGRRKNVLVARHHDGYHCTVAIICSTEGAHCSLKKPCGTSTVWD